MKNLLNAVCVCLLCSLLSTASYGVELANATGKLIPASPDVKVLKTRDADAIRLTIQDAAGTNLFQSEVLGSEEKLFTLDGKPTSLALRDLTGDGVPEVVTSAFYGPRASGLYVFTWDAAAKKFVPVPCTYPKFDLTRDLLVSDVQRDDGSDMVIGADNAVTMLGLVYPEKEGDEPTKAAYTFTFEKDRFVHRNTEPIPTK
ncbi:MAG TPA: hypothetical protein PLP29_09445 [Candidatus Ozemobacteraceae bacterium]|nr:hypothetical protein [Candidatus Ozemobacteraceae bacterium]